VKNRIFAWINLAYRFAVHVLWRLPRRALGYRGDYKHFVETTSSEGYLPLTVPERDRFPEFMQCIHCGLCSLACPELRAAPMSAWDETWTFVAGSSRSLQRADLVVADLTPCSQCGDCDAVCPTGVPITLMAAAVRRLGESNAEKGDFTIVKSYSVVYPRREP
jgi:succinate dehydrogenase/fumarate reductase-like Fe-S protein